MACVMGTNFYLYLQFFLIYVFCALGIKGKYFMLLHIPKK